MTASLLFFVCLFVFVVVVVFFFEAGMTSCKNQGLHRG